MSWLVSYRSCFHDLWIVLDSAEGMEPTTDNGIRMIRLMCVCVCVCICVCVCVCVYVCVKKRRISRNVKECIHMKKNIFRESELVIQFIKQLSHGHMV